MSPPARGHFRPPLVEKVRRNIAVPLLLLRRTAKPFGLLLAVFVGGAFGYWFLGWTTGRNWSLLDCAYMTTITLTTVGFGDALGLDNFALGKLYTMFLIVTGMGTAIYSISSLTAFIVEGYVGTLFREARMERKLEDTENHTIICGAGTTGIHVIEEHIRTDSRFVVVEKDEAKIERIQAEYPERIVFVRGDATEEEVLVKAGLSGASALVAALGTDRDNLYLTVTARYMRKDLEIVTKCLDHDAVGKFTAAGANHVVSPTFIGGMRIASQVLRPHVVHFLDQMLSEQGNARVSEVEIEDWSEIAGRTIAEADLARRVGLLIVALRRPGSKEFIYSPGGTVVLEPGCIVVVIGPVGQVHRLEELAHRSTK